MIQRKFPFIQKFCPFTVMRLIHGVLFHLCTILGWFNSDNILISLSRIIDQGNSLGAALKDERGDIIREFFFSNNNEGISALIQSASHYGKCTAVVESTGNMWIRIHDTLEENGIDTILANPYKTKIIAQAKIKSDKLDARILADLVCSIIILDASDSGNATQQIMA
jgi:hypothetical protein